MADYARLFHDGGSQAVRLPEGHQFPGDRVKVTKVDGGLLLQPVYADVGEWLAALGALGADIPFMEEGRQQPPMPDPPSFDDDEPDDDREESGRKR